MVHFVLQTYLPIASCKNCIELSISKMNKKNLIDCLIKR